MPVFDYAQSLRQRVISLIFGPNSNKKTTPSDPQNESTNESTMEQSQDAVSKPTQSISNSDNAMQLYNRLQQTLSWVKQTLDSEKLKDSPENIDSLDADLRQYIFSMANAETWLSEEQFEMSYLVTDENYRNIYENTGETKKQAIINTLGVEVDPIIPITDNNVESTPDVEYGSNLTQSHVNNNVTEFNHIPQNQQHTMFSEQPNRQEYVSGQWYPNEDNYGEYSSESTQSMNEPIYQNSFDQFADPYYSQTPVQTSYPSQPMHQEPDQHGYTQQPINFMTEPMSHENTMQTQAPVNQPVIDNESHSLYRTENTEQIIPIVDMEEDPRTKEDMERFNIEGHFGDSIEKAIIDTMNEPTFVPPVQQQSMFVQPNQTQTYDEDEVVVADSFEDMNAEEVIQTNVNQQLQFQNEWYESTHQPQHQHFNEHHPQTIQSENVSVEFSHDDEVYFPYTAQDSEPINSITDSVENNSNTFFDTMEDVQPEMEIEETIPVTEDYKTNEIETSATVQRTVNQQSFEAPQFEVTGIDPADGVAAANHTRSIYQSIGQDGAHINDQTVERLYKSDTQPETKPSPKKQKEKDLDFGF